MNYQTLRLDYLKFPVILLIIDAFWLSRPIHKVQIEKIQKSPLQLDMIAGGLFYILAAFAYHRFVQPFAITKKDAFKIGATIGVLMYGTFDLTNKAIFKDYEWNYAIADTLWGGFAMGLASYICFE
jgi:uncharacterized membrane protein